LPSGLMFFKNERWSLCADETDNPKRWNLCAAASRVGSGQGPPKLHRGPRRVESLPAGRKIRPARQAAIQQTMPGSVKQSATLPRTNPGRWGGAGSNRCASTGVIPANVCPAWVGGNQSYFLSNSPVHQRHPREGGDPSHDFNNRLEQDGFPPSRE